MNHKAFYLVLRCCLGVLLFYAGGMKLIGTGIDAFLLDVRNFHLVHTPLDFFIAYTLPYLEIICGVLLLLGKAHHTAAWIGAGLSIVFFYAVNHARLQGIDLHCGCFGNSTEAVKYPQKLIGLALQFLAFVYVACRQRKNS